MPVTAMAVTGSIGALGGIAGGIFGGIQMAAGMAQKRQAMLDFEELMSKYPQYFMPKQVGMAEDVARGKYYEGMSPELMAAIKEAQKAYSNGGISAETRSALKLLEQANKEKISKFQREGLDISKKAYEQGPGTVRQNTAFEKARIANQYGAMSGLGQFMRASGSTYDVAGAQAAAMQKMFESNANISGQEAEYNANQYDALREIAERRRNEYVQQNFLAGQTEDARRAKLIEGYGFASNERNSNLNRYIEALALGSKQKDERYQTYLQQLGISTEALNNDYMMSQMNPWLAQQNMINLRYTGGQQASQAGMNLLGQSFGMFGQGLGGMLSGMS